MTRLKTLSGQFGLIGGICRASSDCILTKEPSPVSTAARWKGHLYVLAEPVTEGGRGFQTAREVITEIAETYYACTSPSITTCLARAIRKANRSLFQHNMEVSGHEKVTLGITCAVVRKEELYLAQVLPGQAYIVHQGRIRAFPLSPSWDPEAAILPTMARLHAVGWAEDISPEFFHSPLRSGDVFCLCTSNVGRFLGHEEAEQVLLYQEPGDVVEQLYRRIHQQGFKEAHAVVVELQPAVSRKAASIFTLAGLQQRARLASETLVGWANLLAGETRRLFQRPKKPRPKEVPARRPPPEPEPAPPPETPPLARPKPAGPWWKTLQEKIYNLFHPRDAYPRLERPRLRMRPARKKRRVVPYLIGAAAVIVLGVLIYLVIAGAQQREVATLNQAIEQAQEQITQARLIAQSQQTEDIAEANRLLDTAEKDLLEVLSPDSPSPRIELVLSDVRDERDRINNVTRFEYLDRLVDLSTFSTTMAAEGFTGGCMAQCLFQDMTMIGDNIYLLEGEKGTIYEYSPLDSRVSPFLWEGKEVQARGRTYLTGTILDVAVLERPNEATGESETWLAAVDADRWLYLYHQGQWEVYVLYSESSWAGRSIDLEGYDGNAYILKGTSDNILKYYRDAYEMAPEPWVKNPQQVRMGDAVDMVIDGYIYLLLKDGTVQVMSQGKLEHELSYQVYPETILASQLFIDPRNFDSPFVYVADRYGRIIMLRKETQPTFVRQLRGPKDGDLQDLRAAVVLEEEGVFYMVAGAGLYKGVLPPQTQELTPTPSPSPAP